MYRSLFPFFNRFRHLFVTSFLALLLVGVAGLVTVTGAGSVFDPNSSAHTLALDNRPVSDGFNAVSSGAADMTYGVKRMMILGGSAVYRAGSGTIDVVAGVGKATSDAVASVGRATQHRVVAVAGGVKRAGITTSRVPGKVASTVTSKATVSALIEPAAYRTEALPVIVESATSYDVLATLQAEQRSAVEQQIAEQAVANRRLAGTVIAGDAARGGYPDKWHNARQDSMVDDWGMYNRECVSYAAWKVHQRYGNMPYWGGIGNANQWLRNARNAGIPTSRTPKVHSVAISMAGYYGHAMWVEKVEGDMIYVSQYNYDLNGRYSEMWLRASDFTYIYFQ